MLPVIKSKKYVALLQKNPMQMIKGMLPGITSYFTSDQLICTWDHVVLLSNGEIKSMSTTFIQFSFIHDKPSFK